MPDPYLHTNLVGRRVHVTGGHIRKRHSDPNAAWEDVEAGSEFQGEVVACWLVTDALQLIVACEPSGLLLDVRGTTYVALLPPEPPDA